MAATAAAAPARAIHRPRRPRHPRPRHRRRRRRHRRRRHHRRRHDRHPHYHRHHRHPHRRRPHHLRQHRHPRSHKPLHRLRQAFRRCGGWGAQSRWQPSRPPRLRSGDGKSKAERRANRKQRGDRGASSHGRRAWRQHRWDGDQAGGARDSCAGRRCGWPRLGRNEPRLPRGRRRGRKRTRHDGSSGGGGMPRTGLFDVARYCRSREWRRRVESAAGGRRSGGRRWHGGKRPRWCRRT